MTTTSTASGTRSGLSHLLLPAAVLVAVAWCWSLQYPFWPHRNALLDQGKIVSYSWIAFALFIGGISLWLWSLWAILPALRGIPFHQVRRVLFPVICIVYVAFVLMYPTNAIDVYIYAVRSRLLTEYGANPSAALPMTWWDVDPYMHFASREWADDTSPYGPLWNQLAAPVTALSGDNIGLAVIGFKILSVIAIALTGWLIYDALDHVGNDWALVAALFWLLNPLVLWDGIGNAHNDVTLMLPTIAALWAWSRRYDNLVIPLLVAAFLIKYVSIILFPIAIVALWRRNSRAQRIEGALWAFGGGLLVVAFSLFPFYDLGAIVDSARAQGARISASLAWWILATVNRLEIAQPTVETAQNVAYAITIAAIAFWVWRVWTKPADFPRACFEATFAFMLVASTNQRGWYVIWLVPLAAMIIPAEPWRRTLTWSVTSMAGHACSIWLWFVWDWDNWDRYWYSSIMVGVVYLPVLAVTLWDVVSPGLRSRQVPGFDPDHLQTPHRG